MCSRLIITKNNSDAGGLMFLIQLDSRAEKSRDWTHVVSQIVASRVRPSHARNILRQSVEVDLPKTAIMAEAVRGFHGVR